MKSKLQGTWKLKSTWNFSIVCKKMIFAGIGEFKLVQEVHMGLETISNQRQKDLTVKYGQKLKRESNMTKNLKFWGYIHPNEFLARE